MMFLSYLLLLFTLAIFASDDINIDQNKFRFIKSAEDANEMDVIGTGSEADIWKAIVIDETCIEGLSIGNQFACKVFDDQEDESLENEIDFFKCFKPKNDSETYIAKYFGTTTLSDDQIGICMELGLKTMNDLEKDSEEFNEAKVQVGEAIQFLHDNNWVHMDIKGDNVMKFKESGRWKLIDFGLSEQYEDMDSDQAKDGKRNDWDRFEKIGLGPINEIPDFEYPKLLITEENQEEKNSNTSEKNASESKSDKVESEKVESESNEDESKSEKDESESKSENDKSEKFQHKKRKRKDAREDYKY